jgi:hypothetical protein
MTRGGARQSMALAQLGIGTMTMLAASDYALIFVGGDRERWVVTSERKMNGVTYLRVEGGDLAHLCSDIITRLYARHRAEPMGLIV